MDRVLITYNGAEIWVEKSVADYLEDERKREQSAAKSDQRHLSDKEIDSFDIHDYLLNKPVELIDEIIRDDEIERLLKSISTLSEDEQSIIINRFFRQKELAEIANERGITYQAVQDRLKQILNKLKTFLF